MAGLEPLDIDLTARIGPLNGRFRHKFFSANMIHMRRLAAKGLASGEHI